MVTGISNAISFDKKGMRQRYHVIKQAARQLELRHARVVYCEYRRYIFGSISHHILESCNYYDELHEITFSFGFSAFYF